MSLASILNVALPPYNAVAGQDCTLAFQQACDDCLTDDIPHTIYVPANPQPYLVSRPILADAQYLSFAGDGAALSVIQAAGERFCDVLQFGAPRASQGQTLTPASAFWVDSTPILDSSAGQRYGLRTGGVAYAYFQGTPFDMGPQGIANWSATRQLTIDFAFYNPAGWNGGNNGIRLFGLGSPDARTPSPFYCGVEGSGTSLLFDFTTSDGVWRRMMFALPAPAMPLQRVSIQVDLTHPAVLAFVNGTEVATDLSQIGSGWSPTLSLQANEYRQFQLGTCLVDAAFNPGNITDQTIFGFKITGAPLYNNNGTGTAQTRIDGLALNDSRQFFGPETDFYALLPLQDGANAYRYIAWTGGQPGGYYGIGSGLFLHATSLAVLDTRTGNFVRDLTLTAAVVPSLTGYGRALCHGPVYDFSARDCIFIGGAHNFGALNGAVGYPIKVRDCEFDYGGDAAIYAQGCGMWWGQRLTIKYWGREAIRSLYSFLDLRQVFYAPGGPGDCVLKFHNSSGAVLDNHTIDFEGGGPALAHVYCEAGAYSGPTQLTLRNVTFGTQAAGAHFIALRGPKAPNDAYAPATLTLENTQQGGFWFEQPIPGVWSVVQY